MSVIKFKLNGESQSVDIDPSTPLLWTLRDHLQKTGTKFGCGVGQCGACTVHLNGTATRSCLIPAKSVNGAEVTTIEGLSDSNDHVLQTLWIELNVPQCGYCQAGVLMAAADLLKRKPKPTDDDIDKYVSNICRCGTYPRIRAAIHRAATNLTAMDVASREVSA